MAKNTHDILSRVIDEVEGKPGWLFRLIDDEDGLRLVITDTKCVDAYDPRRNMSLSHFFPVPTATYNESSWRRWVFECCRGVENHELGEWIRWGDKRPFAPLHGPGENPYMVHEFRDDIERRTTQDGSVRGVVKYSLAEIDRMRRLMLDHLCDQQDGHMPPGSSARVEDRLRTYMMNGTTVAEIETMFPESDE